MVDRVVGITLERVSDQVCQWQRNVPWLAGMEIPEAANLPAVRQITGPPMGPRGLGYVVAEACGEEMPGIVITVAIVNLDVGAVRDHAAVLADLVKGVRPSISNLGAEPMPSAKP